MTSSSIAALRKQLLKRSRELSRKNGKKTEAADIWAALDESEKIELENVHKALERIGRGLYGICIDCQSPLDDLRLESQPAIERCTVCENESVDDKELVA